MYDVSQLTVPWMVIAAQQIGRPCGFVRGAQDRGNTPDLFDKDEEGSDGVVTTIRELDPVYAFLIDGTPLPPEYEGIEWKK